MLPADKIYQLVQAGAAGTQAGMYGTFIARPEIAFNSWNRPWGF